MIQINEEQGTVEKLESIDREVATISRSEFDSLVESAHQLSVQCGRLLEQIERSGPKNWKKVATDLIEQV